MSKFVVLGGAGVIGRTITSALLGAGHDVTVIDADVLTDELPPMPAGEVVILLGSARRRPRWPWLVPVDSALATCRILPQIEGRPVLLLSSADIYGSAPGPLREDTPPRLPWSVAQIDEWCDEAIALAREPCPPWRAAATARRMAQADPSGRWIFALAKLAQERLVTRAVDARLLTVLRLADVSGTGQDCLIGRLVRQALSGDPLVVPAAARSFVPMEDVARLVAAGLPPGVYNVGGEPTGLADLAGEIRARCGSASALVTEPAAADDHCGIVDSARLAAAGYRVAPAGEQIRQVARAMAGRPVLEPPLPVVVPPRAGFPDRVAARQQASLWTGEVKHGNRWSQRLTTELASALAADDEHTVLVTASGTAAWRAVIAAAAGPAAPGDVALLPSFTFPATAEVLLQLGYRLRFVDVDEGTWTLDPEQVRRELAAGDARLVACVDTFGAPCDYAALREVCRASGVPLVADSAASLGSRIQGIPVAAQADGHAFSMSFAKVLSAGGAGGAALLPADAAAAMLRDQVNWCRSELMDELHAIYALDQLAMLEDLVRRRNRVADIYRDGLSDVPGLVAQEIRPGDTHSFVHWVMRVSHPAGRDVLQRELMDCAVQTKPYFSALHLTGLGHSESLPVTERLATEVLALPMSSELTEDDARNVVIAVRYCLAQASGPQISGRRSG
ncbi:MAG TPA: aminotransferase class V-fold PLP-dependent enzyme [Streptosporangiaceae bacterium]|jgi:dTDP-4-amino-4,6-dideoxygalactose transaminase/nucleoside-diphosphate-sugar epimerase